MREYRVAHEKTPMVAKTSTVLASRYETAAPRWGDKMRVLGYYDGYVGFLSETQLEPSRNKRLIDIGAGTASFAEAWTETHGCPDDLVLLDPSQAMLDRGRLALNGCGIEPTLVQGCLGKVDLEPADEALAAHVIEHCEDPLTALKQIRDLLRPEGRLHLVVSKPHWCNAIIWLQWRHRTFSEGEILGLLNKAGFSIERVHAFPSGPPSRTSRGIVATRRS